MVAGKFNVSVIVVRGIKLKRRLRDKLTFEPEHPHIAEAIFQHGDGSMDLTLGHKAHEWGIDGIRFKINEMLKLAGNPNDQFLIFVLVRLIRGCADFNSFFGIHFKYREQFVHPDEFYVQNKTSSPTFLFLE